jgi:hypothetical protein
MSQGSLDPSSVKSYGRYTIPRTWGVYEVRCLREGKRFRFGNHPIRHRELSRKYGEGEVKLVGWLYKVRSDAKEAADRKNCEWLLSHNAQ